MAKSKIRQVQQATKAAAASAQSIIIRQPEQSRLAFEIEGDSLIQNNFSQKAVEQMLRKHMGLPNPREAKKPRECIEQATVKNTAGKVCIPSTAFKKGILMAVGAMGDKSLKKTVLRTSLFIEGNSVPITFDEKIDRMDMVRTAGMNRTPDVRFRPMFVNWKARLVISFDAATLKAQTILDLLNRAGKVGVGEWRPEKDGTFGTYRVSRNISDPKEIGQVLAECAPPLVPLRIPDWAMDCEIDPELLRKVAGSDVNHDTSTDEE